jgi:hypothetical protein
MERSLPSLKKSTVTSFLYSSKNMVFPTSISEYLKIGPNEPINTWLQHFTSTFPKDAYNAYIKRGCDTIGAGFMWSLEEATSMTHRSIEQVRFIHRNLLTRRQANISTSKKTFLKTDFAVSTSTLMALHSIAPTA